MKIYTKTGDKGTTQVYTSEVLRLDKNDAILECYGSIDELNSHIGLLSALMGNIDSDINDDGSLSPTFMFDIQKNVIQYWFCYL
jgi:cob(I)alamin adenosyltransferase